MMKIAKEDCCNILHHGDNIIDKSRSVHGKKFIQSTETRGNVESGETHALDRIFFCSSLVEQLL